MSQMALLSPGVQLETANGNITAVFERRFLPFQVQFADEHGRVARHYFNTGYVGSFHHIASGFNVAPCPLLARELLCPPAASRAGALSISLSLLAKANQLLKLRYWLINRGIQIPRVSYGFFMSYFVIIRNLVEPLNSSAEDSC